MKWRWLPIFLVIILCPDQGYGTDKTVSIAATEFPPYYSADLKDGGFMTKLVTTAFNAVGYDVTIKFLPWKRALEGTKAGKYDGLYSVWYRKEREQWFVFSAPLPPSEIGFFKRKDQNISFEVLEDLKPYRIGIVRGYAYPPQFNAAYLDTDVSDDDESNLKKLLAGRLHLVLIDRAVGKYIIDEKYPERRHEVEWMTPPIEVIDQHLVISRKVPDFERKLADFDAGLRQISQEGTLQTIMREHGF